MFQNLVLYLIDEPRNKLQSARTIFIGGRGSRRCCSTAPRCGWRVRYFIYFDPIERAAGTADLAAGDDAFEADPTLSYDAMDRR